MGGVLCVRCLKYGLKLGSLLFPSAESFPVSDVCSVIFGQMFGDVAGDMNMRLLYVKCLASASS